MSDTIGTVFDFSDYGTLLGLVTNSIIAAAVLGLVGGLVGVFVQLRDMQFAVHGISELSFAGAAGALLLGINVALGSVLGSLVAGALIGLLGVRARDRNSVIGVLMPFGLGLGVLFLALYPGRSVNMFGVLRGQLGDPGVAVRVEAWLSTWPGANSPERVVWRTTVYAKSLLVL